MKREPPGRRSRLTKLLTSVIALVALAATLAACGGGNDDTTATMGAGTQAAAGGGGLAVEEIGDAGPVLVDSSGRALYTSDLEEGGKVRCTDACVAIWQPLTAEDGVPAKPESLPGKLGTINRPDGDRQLTLDGAPLYSFNEEGPEEVTGDGFADSFDGNQFTWSVVALEAGSSGASDAEESSSTGRSYSY